MLKEIKIGDFIISETSPTFIIAELSANHNKDLNIATESIKAICKAGADAVKIQTYRPESMTLDSGLDIYQTRKDSLWAGRKLIDVYREGALPYKWHPELKKIAEDLGLIFFSTPFDVNDVDFLETLQVPAYKVASMEITDIPLISHIAKKGKPVILSTGIAENRDIQLAINTCRQENNQQIIILKCTSSYPTPYEDAHLKNIAWLKKQYKTWIGLSDHTLDVLAPIAAIALGAKIIEKHFILDKSIKSLDAPFSLDANQFSRMVRAVRNTEKLLGEDNYIVTEKMKKARISSRSILVTTDVKKGEILNANNIKVLRPGYGLHPKYYYEVIGKKAAKNLSMGTPLQWNDIIK